MEDIYPQISTIASHYEYPATPRVVTEIQERISEVQRFVSDILNLLNISFTGMSDNRAAATVLELIISALAALATALIIYFAWQRLGQLKQQSALARKGATTTTAILDAQAWKLKSEEYAAATSWRQACRALYMGFLNLLDEHEVLTFNPAKTNYEYLYELRDRHDLQPVFSDIVNCVESVWFGNRPATEKDYELCLDRLQNLQTILTDRGINNHSGPGAS